MQTINQLFDEYMTSIFMNEDSYMSLIEQGAYDTANKISHNAILYVSEKLNIPTSLVIAGMRTQAEAFKGSTYSNEEWQSYIQHWGF